MSCHVERNAFQYVCSSLTVSMLCITVLCSGCRIFSSRPKPGLLGPRAVIPAPYVTPSSGGAVALPPEPSFTVAPMVPAGVNLEDNLVEPVAVPAWSMNPPVDDVKDLSPLPAGSGIVLPPNVRSQNLTYTVKKGDSLWLISEMYGITVPELATENNLDAKKTLRVGKTLQLPPGAYLRDPAELKRASTARKTKASASAGTSTTRKASAGTAAKIANETVPASGTYTVKGGDNLWTICRRFGVNSRDVMAWNNLKSDVLQIGQKLRMTGTASAPAATTGTTTPVTPPKTVEPTPPKNTTPDIVKDTLTTDKDTPGNDTVAPGTGDEGDVLPVIKTGALDLPKKLAHTITDGETLQIIADMYGTTVEAIKKENPAVKGDGDLKANGKLMVPYQ